MPKTAKSDDAEKPRHFRELKDQQYQILSNSMYKVFK